MYARLSAVLSTCFPSITTSLVAKLKSDVFGTGGAARRLAQARLFAELAKFGRVPPALVVDCLKACIDGFNSAEVSVMCVLLETCGQYLYAQAETQARCITIHHHTHWNLHEPICMHDQFFTGAGHRDYCIIHTHELT